MPGENNYGARAAGAKLIHAKVQEIRAAERYSIRAHSRDKELLEDAEQTDGVVSDGLAG